ncbi:MAG: hypothetical protein L6R40_002108 [Gallowayella cf. fulva]|nr:MAG: hypothetical protein L6R40_002108 [Xanthomendoza cf. fulva]
MFCATWAAVRRAVVARSASANYNRNENKISIGMSLTRPERNSSNPELHESAYLLHIRLDPSIIHLLDPLPHRRRKPSKPLRQRRHGIFLELVHARHPLFARSPPTASGVGGSRSESRILPPLTRRQIRPPHLILAPLPRKEILIHLLPIPTPRPHPHSHPTIPLPQPLPPPHSHLLPLLLFLLRPPPKLPPLNNTPQPLLPLLPHLPPIPFLPPPNPHLRIQLPPNPSRPLSPEPPPRLIPTLLHPQDLVPLESIHRDAAHERDVHAQPPVEARAREADEGAEFGGGPLRGWRGAVAAGGVAGGFLEGEELCRGPPLERLLGLRM